MINHPYPEGVSGTLTAVSATLTGTSDSFGPARGAVDVSISGISGDTIVLERVTDGVNWRTVQTFTSDFEGLVTLYRGWCRLRMTVDGGGTVAYSAQPTDAMGGGGSSSASGTNITQIAGVAVKTGHGTAADALRVEMPTDGTGQVNVAQGGTAVSATAPLNVTGATAPLVTSLDWKYAAASGGITDTSDVVLHAAAGASLYNALQSIQIINTDATVGTEVVIKDGSTVIWRGFAPASIALVTQESMVNITFSPPLTGSANTALNAACITTSSQTYINAQGTVVG